MENSAKYTQGRVDPKNNKALLDYLAVIADYHKYIDFLDTAVDDRETASYTPTSNRLYVTPSFSEIYIDPQSDPGTWPALISMDEALTKYDRLFVLGDPGMGKTTLVHRLSYLLADPGNAYFQEQLNHLIPFPITLRDLRYDKLDNWDDLLEAFFQQPKMKNQRLPEDLLEQIFSNGQAFIFLDGLDEVTHPESRMKLSAAIRNGINRWPRCKWWCTSRIVGFNQDIFWEGIDFLARDLAQTIEGEARFNYIPTARSPFNIRRVGLPDEDNKDIIEKLSSDFLADKHSKHSPPITYRKSKYADTIQPFSEAYLAPFSDAHIERFMRLWLEMNEKREVLQAEALGRFMSSLSSHSGISHLARIPNLLTMMALYYRINQDFPDGRIELYRTIAKAYGENIKRRRHLTHLTTLDFAEQTRCLAALALEMQKRRTQQSAPTYNLLIIGQDDAESIFVDRLKKLHPQEDEQVLKERVKGHFEGWKKHSEILVPRTDTDFGFLHLSYQEFFAAEALKEEFQRVTSRRAKPEEEDVFWKEMKTYADNIAWHETIVLFFESLRVGWEGNSEDCLYAFEKLFDWSQATNTINHNFDLCAVSVLTDEYVANSFTREKQLKILDQIWFINWIHYDLRVRDKLIYWGIKKGYYVVLNNETEVLPINCRYVEVETTFDNFGLLTNIKECVLLSLDSTSISDLAPLANMANLNYLSLRSTQVLNLAPLANLAKLSNLNLSSTQVSDLAPLANLAKLSNLNLSSTQVSDLTPLANLVKLIKLDLSSTQVSDLTPLANLANLYILHLFFTQVSDLSPLATMSNLIQLELGLTQVSDVSPLANLPKLIFLNLVSAQVSDVSPLANLSKLGYLNLNSTQVSDISPLANLTDLHFLDLVSTQVSDISPLANLVNMNDLYLASTQVSNVSPLANLVNLNYLYLGSTHISDVSPLANLTNLHTLYLNSTQVSDISTLANLVNLNYLDLRDTPAAKNTTAIKQLKEKLPGLNIKTEKEEEQ